MRLTVIITTNYTVYVTKEKYVGKEYINVGGKGREEKCISPEERGNNNE